MRTDFLIKPDVSRYNNADHTEFHKLSYRTARKNESVIQAPDLINEYQVAVEQESNIYKWIRRSEYTEKKAKTDHDRGVIYSGMLGTVQIALNHFDPTIRNSAAHVSIFLKSYGDVNHMDYDGQTAAVDSIITNLRGAKYFDASQALGLIPWIDELEVQNDLFKTYVDDAAEEKLEKPKIKPKAARRATDEALRKVTDRVTALAILNGSDPYLAFADEFNGLAEHYNTLVREHYGRLHAKTDLSAGEVEPIAVQPFTGKPVYVIPTVKIRKTEKDGTVTIVELQFNKDFSVDYKNNVDPGSATLTITGIGKYAGEIITTFNISD
jgi:hypothetical protein